MSHNGSPKIRLVLLWHMHQPFYKDMVTGEYRLPWVRLHALKDYYGMVKLLDEFPQVHQNFNLVPSLVAQIQDYVSGQAHDPFLDLVAKPAAELTPADRRFALQYLFQANPVNMIGRYPRYRELWERYRATCDRPEGPEAYFGTRDYADLQVLSQLAWFDEYFLDEPDVAALVQKGEDFSRDDQQLVIAKEREILGQGAARLRRGGAARIHRAFRHAVLSPHSAAAVRYQRRRAVHARIEPANAALPASGRRQSPDRTRTGFSRGAVRGPAQGTLALGGKCLRGGRDAGGPAGNRMDGDR